MDIRLAIASIAISLLAVCSYTKAAETQEIVILKRPKNGVFNEGETIFLECANPEWDFANRIQGQWLKKAVKGFLNGSNEDSSEVEITANSVLINDEIKNQDRYQANAKLNEGTFHFTFEIKEARTSDSGLYRCVILTDSLTSQSKNIIVVSEIDSVRWYIIQDGEKREIQAGETLRMKEGDEINVTCEAKGAYPQPKMDVFTSEIPTNDDEYSDEPPASMLKPTYITDKFHQDSTQHAGSLLFDSSLSATPLTAAFHLHRNEVVCAGVLEGKDAVTSSFNVILEQYKPYFKCATTMKAKLGAGNFSITCIVHALPEVSETKVFLVGAVEKTQLVGDDKTEKDYSVFLETIDDDSELLNMTLTIAEVKKKHLTKYEFICINDIGLTYHFITLVEDKGPQFASKTESLCSALHQPWHIFSTLTLSLIIYSMLF